MKNFNAKYVTGTLEVQQGEAVLTLSAADLNEYFLIYGGGYHQVGTGQEKSWHVHNRWQAWNRSDNELVKCQFLLSGNLHQDALGLLVPNTGYTFSWWQLTGQHIDPATLTAPVQKHILIQEFR